MDKDLIELLENVYTNLKNPKDWHIETGYAELDDFLAYHGKGSLITIGGVASMYKSVFCRNIIEKQLISGKKCLYFNLSGTKEQLIRSLLALNTNLEAHKLRTGYLQDNDFNKISEVMNRMADWNLQIADSSCYKIEKIAKNIEQKKPDYVFIDSLEEIRTDNKFDAHSILKAIKECAIKADTVIFLTSTLKNSVEFNKDKIPTWKDFEDSESVINYSDEILLLYRPDFYFSEQDIPIGHKKGTVEVISSKLIKGTLQYYYEPSTCRIKENVYYDSFEEENEYIDEVQNEI